MQNPLRPSLVLVAACAVCSLGAYFIAHHRGYESGYKNGFSLGMRHGFFFESMALYGTLRQLREGDEARTARYVETNCFTAANFYYHDPTARPGEASAWARNAHLDQFPDIEAARALAKGLAIYRAAYRTNSADWDTHERQLDAQLAKIKSDDPKAWDNLRMEPTGNWLITKKVNR